MSTSTKCHLSTCKDNLAITALLTTKLDLMSSKSPLLKTASPDWDVATNLTMQLPKPTRNLPDVTTSQELAEMTQWVASLLVTLLQEVARSQHQSNHQTKSMKSNS
jgi:hypothetical protein